MAHAAPETPEGTTCNVDTRLLAEPTQKKTTKAVGEDGIIQIM